jgi:hypothetical protein
LQFQHKYYESYESIMNKYVALSVILVIVLSVIATTMMLKSSYAKVKEHLDAPAVISGDNVYITWWTNKTANNNEEVMFRSSNDGGASFTDKINLINTTDADSWRAEIAGEGPNVLVSWWETNQTSDTPVARISTDSGQTFGPILRLATNGTIGEVTEGEEPEEGE